MRASVAVLCKDELAARGGIFGRGSRGKGLAQRHEPQRVRIVADKRKAGQLANTVASSTAASAAPAAAAAASAAAAAAAAAAATGAAADSSPINSFPGSV